MEIKSITPYFIARNRNNAVNNSPNMHCAVSPISGNLSPLKADTVSFSGNTVMEAYTAMVNKKMPRELKVAAVNFLDALEAVANKLKTKGYSFDREYCEAHVQKTTDSWTDKVNRSGSLDVRDPIRATLYCKDPYDLSNLVDNLLPAMEERGFVLANIEKKVKELAKRGRIPTAEELKTPDKRIRVPDLDIRLDNASDQVFKLPPELRYSISEPQKSGYEDIQMRFVKEGDKKRNPIYHELIILFGPATKNAKNTEYEDVYQYLREFGELNIKFDNTTVGSAAARAKCNITLVEDMFRNNISNRLFKKAKDDDFWKTKAVMPAPGFTPNDGTMVKNYITGISEAVRGWYRLAVKNAKSPEERKELIKNRESDKNLLKKICSGLQNTVEKYTLNAEKTEV